MNLLRLLCCLLVFPVAASAVDRVTASVKITTLTTNNMTFVVNGDTRTWKSSVTTPSSEILTNSTAAGAATNLYEHLIASRPSKISAYMTASDTVRLDANAGTAIVISGVGSYFTVTYSTQTVTMTTNVAVPYTAQPSGSRATIANGIIDWINQASTDIADARLTANVPLLDANNVWSGSNHFANVNGTVSQLTNGTFYSPVIRAPTTTNLVNYGNAISSPGATDGSEQFGSGALAEGDFSTALGYNAHAADIYSMALGYNANTSEEQSVAIGPSASATRQYALAVGRMANAAGDDSLAIGTSSAATTNEAVAIGLNAAASGISSMAIGNQSAAQEESSIAIGYHTQATATNSIAIGNGAVAGFKDSVAIGTASVANADNEIALGSSADRVYVPGSLLVAGSVTAPSGYNHFVPKGTNTFPLGSDLAFVRYANSSLASGVNANIILGTNVFMQVSGPTAAFSLDGINGSPNRDGKIALIANRTGWPMTINNESGADSTAGNRIRTPDGLGLVLRGDSLVMLIYSASLGRWIVGPSASAGSGYGLLSLTCSTNATVATSSSTNTFTGWNYNYTSAGIGLLTNTTAWVTNSGPYLISFGASLLGTTSDVLSMQVWTNGVRCSIVELTATMSPSSAVAETGFKQFMVNLPANTLVDIRVGNDSPASVTVGNACFNIHSSQ